MVFIINPNDILIALEDPKTLAEIIITFGATLAGAFVGFGLAILSDRRSKKGEIKEKKKQMIDSLIQELQDIQKGISDSSTDITWDTVNLKFTGEFSMVEMYSFESSVKSGYFILLRPKLQAEISQTYLTIQHYIWNVEQALKFQNAPIFNNVDHDKVGKHITSKTNEFLGRMRKEIKNLLPKLESAKDIVG